MRHYLSALCKKAVLRAPAKRANRAYHAGERVKSTNPQHAASTCPNEIHDGPPDT